MAFAGGGALQGWLLSMHELIGFALFVLAVYGLSNAMAVLKIGQFFFGVSHCKEDGCPAPSHPHDKRRFLGRIPWFGEMFYCPPCLAFWIGMLASQVIMSPAGMFIAIWWKGMIVDGLVASAIAWLLFTWTEKNAVGTDI